MTKVQEYEKSIQEIKQKDFDLNKQIEKLEEKKKANMEKLYDYKFILHKLQKNEVIDVLKPGTYFHLNHKNKKAVFSYHEEKDTIILIKKVSKKEILFKEYNRFSCGDSSYSSMKDDFIIVNDYSNPKSYLVEKVLLENDYKIIDAKEAKKMIEKWLNK